MSNESNPYRAPKASLDVEPRAREYVESFEQDGMRHPIRSDAFAEATTQAWETLKSGGGHLIGLAFALGAVSFFSARAEETIAGLGNSTGYIVFGLTVTIFAQILDVVLRLQLFTKALAKVRFDPGAFVRTAPTGYQTLQGVILSLPLITAFALMAGAELVGLQSEASTWLLLVALPLTVFAAFFMILTYTALPFIVDQNCSAFVALRRALKLIWANLGGYLLFTCLIAPLVVLAGFLAFCLGVFVSIALLHCTIAVAYNRVAIPGRAYLEEGWQAERWDAPDSSQAGGESQTPDESSRSTQEPDTW